MMILPFGGIIFLVKRKWKGLIVDFFILRLAYCEVFRYPYVLSGD